MPQIVLSNTFKISSYETLKSIENPLVVNLVGWEQVNSAKPFTFNPNNELTNADIEDLEVSGIKKHFSNLRKISLEWMNSSENKYDFLAFGIEPIALDDIYVVYNYAITHSKSNNNNEWINVEHIFDIAVNATLWIAYAKDESVSEGDDAGYVRNLRVETENNGINNSFFVNNFNNQKDKNTFKIKSFENQKTNNTFKIKSFTNQKDNLFYNIGRNLLTPPKRIIFKNFED